MLFQFKFFLFKFNCKEVNDIVPAIDLSEICDVIHW